MKLNLEINKKVTCPFSDNFFLKIAKKTIELSGCRFLFSKKNVSISLAIIGNKEIRAINNNFRKKNCPTDVLSFSNFSSNRLKKEKGREIFLGEIVISFPYVKNSAKMENKEVGRELAHVFSHGILQPERCGRRRWEGIFWVTIFPRMR